MSFSADKIAYDQTGSFSKIVLDYLADAPALKSFYNYRPDLDGIKKAVQTRKDFPVNRQLLSDALQQQYAAVGTSAKLKANIEALLSEDTFTICTAHQPNIFTGHLYFIYKILHAIRLSDELNEKIAGKSFVPVYYMGSEDADLQELGEVHINGKHYQWETKQTGAVGRMKIDKAFIKIIDEVEGQLSVEQNGVAIMQAVRNAYQEGITIEAATFHFVHELFNEYGLIILLPDSRAFKNEFSNIITRELDEQFSHQAVSETVSAFPAEYKVQAAGRDINLFYLDEGFRERIEKDKNSFVVANTELKFSEVELKEELKNVAERFSPNVILRPVFQEMILPDVVFIGGGGELAYWLELKKVFEAANAFFPVLMLRNSFAIVNKKTSDNLAKLSFSNADLFRSQTALLNDLVKRQSTVQLDLTKEKATIQETYEKIGNVSSAIDSTLSGHVKALHTQVLQRLHILEKKMLKAEKKKFEAQQRQIDKIKNAVYPGGILQERVDNILPYISKHGNEFIDILYKNSQPVTAHFTIITEA